MENENIIRSMLGVGMLVEINPSDDRSREKLVSGNVREILTSSESHPHGIKVKLVSGQIGRVRKIESNEVSPELPVEPSVIGQIHEHDHSRSLENIISDGEDHFSEFKSSMLWSERLSPEQIKKNQAGDVKQYGRATSLVIIARTIAGFLNSDGGALLIGVKENKDTKDDEVIGVEAEFGKLKDPCEDGYRRKILDSIIKPYLPSFIFNHFNNYLKIEFSKIDGKHVCGIRVNKSDKKVFLNIQNKDRFFVRIDASTRELSGEEIVDFCIKRFA
jgi:uncharacterized repeat protein (TIGR03833 family)